MSLGVIVQDQATDNACLARIAAGLRGFQDITIGDQTFRGIGIAPLEGEFCRWIRAQGPYEPTLTFTRRSEEGQQEPNYIHHDAMMGDWTALLYLNPEPADGDGTIFWNKADHISPPNWIERFRVRAQFNRAVIFPSNWWHSRALFENYGHGDAARLIQVAFGKVAA